MRNITGRSRRSLLLSGAGRSTRPWHITKRPWCSKVPRLRPTSTSATSPARKAKRDEATRQFQAALRLLQDYAEDLFNLGIYFDKRGKNSEAIRFYQAAISGYQMVLHLKPDQADAHNNLGIVLARKGQTVEAIEQFREALRIQPDYADARRNLDAALAGKAQAWEAGGGATSNTPVK